MKDDIKTPTIILYLLFLEDLTYRNDFLWYTVSSRFFQQKICFSVKESPRCSIVKNLLNSRRHISHGPYSSHGQLTDNIYYVQHVSGTLEIRRTFETFA